MSSKFARGLAAAAAAGSLFFASAAVGQAQRWNVVTPGLAPAAGLPYTNFAAADPSGNLYVAARR